jgi:hypothetical protein
MDKRVGADARRFEQPSLSDRFGVFAKALDTASIRESQAQKSLIQRRIAELQLEEEKSRR